MLSRPTLCGAAAVVLSLLAVPVGTGCSGDVGTGSGGGTGTGGSTTSGTTTTSTTSTGTGPAPTCTEVCPAVVAAGCKQGPPTVDSCKTGCASVSMSCAAEFNALLACGGATPDFICDPAGNPYPKGCETENAALVSCRTGVPALCIEVCPAVTAAGCSGGPPDVSSCQSGCGTASTKCPTEFAAVSSCWTASSTFTCNAKGLPFAAGCEAQGDALFACLAK